jgi:hypothetical protein
VRSSRTAFSNSGGGELLYLFPADLLQKLRREHTGLGRHHFGIAAQMVSNLKRAENGVSLRQGANGGTRMQLLTPVVLTVIASVLVCNAQAPYTPRGTRAVPSPTGRIELTNLEIGNQVSTLDQLVHGSELIIDGTVQGVLSSVLRVQNDPASVSTNSEIAVNEVLRGELPFGKQTVVLGQMGGAVEGYDIVVPEDPLVRKGDRYILFLERAKLDRPENKLGVPRYLALGYWSGKVKISDQGTIQFLPASAEELHSFDGWTVAAFKAAVKERIKWSFGPPPQPPKVNPGLPPTGVHIPPTGPPKP